MAFTETFSRRNCYSGAPKEITAREAAPEGLRAAVLETLHTKIGWKPSALRDIICSVVRVRPDPGNWSEYPNIWDEAQRLMYGCEWFKVYDIIEAVYARFAKQDRQRGSEDAQYFADEINAVFLEDGIGWQLLDGQVITRGPETFESVATEAAPRSRNPTVPRPLRISMMPYKVFLDGRTPICQELCIMRWARWNVWPAT